MIAIESILGVAILILFLAFVTRRRERKGRGGQADCSDIELKSPVEISGDDWCEALENALGIAAFSLDDSMRLSHMGPGASRLMSRTSGEARAHLFDIIPKTASRPMLEGAALARRGISSSRFLDWEGLDVGASFVPLTHGKIAILIMKLGEV